MKNIGDLKQRLQQTTQENREEIEQITKEESEKLLSNCKNVYQSAQNTIEQDTAAFAQKTKSIIKAQQTFLLRVIAIWPALLIISLLGSTFIASWGLTRLLAHKTTQILEHNNEIQAQKKTLELLKNKTWGIELYQNSNGKFLIVPPNSELSQQAPWKCNGKPCFKL